MGLDAFHTAGNRDNLCESADQGSELLIELLSGYIRETQDN